MHGRRRLLLCVVAALAVALSLATPAGAIKPVETPEAFARGKARYESVCLYCHGAAGNGAGPASFWIGAYSGPRPKDFTKEEYKLRSTPSGELPTDEDLFRTVTSGIPGLMPEFSFFTEIERWEIIYYVKSFVPGFTRKQVAPMTIPPPLLSSPESIERGRAVYLRYQCEVCHGEDGKGDDPSAFESGALIYRGKRMPAPDLTNLKAFKNGAAPRDIYRTLVSGMDGSPMPSYAGEFAGKEEDIWHLVNYILSLSTRERR